MSSRFSKSYPLAVVALALGMAACAEAPSAPQAGLAAKVASTIGAPAPELWHEVVWVCKVGSDASFAVSVNGAAPVNHSVANGECEGVFTHTGNREDGFMVTVTELDVPGTVLDRIVVETTRFEEITDTRVITDSRSATVESIATKGAIITFYNTPVQTGGGEGCTPGYWKQRHHFDSWSGYAPDQLFSSVFENAFPGKTLVQVLSQGGGGLNALGRHTVAALLNASSSGVSYGVATPADVIAQFNAAFPGSNGTYETLKNTFEGLNEKGCPLN